MTPAHFYKGYVSHRRFGQPDHALRYKIAYVLLDLDQVPAANKLSTFFGVGKSGLMSVQAQDHGDGEHDDLAQWVRGFLRSHDVRQNAAKIELLTLPRMFGFVFNPISIYFVYDELGALHHVLYEVNNTFGDRHFYLCPAQQNAYTHKHSCDKALYVSPFFEVLGKYHFTISRPDEAFSLTINYEKNPDQEALRAHLSAKKHAISNRSSLRILVEFPLMTLGVVFAIHWEALKLKIKGAKFYHHKKTQGAAQVTIGEVSGATADDASFANKEAA